MGARHTGEETLEKHGPVWRVYRYGMLVFIVVVLVWSVHFTLAIPPGYEGGRYLAVLPAFMLLFFHLAGFFRWPRRVSIALWTLTLSSIALTWFYVLFLYVRLFYP